ncbi:hypothetical protein [Halobacterium rubrum]|nr:MULTISPECIES: hypothetical protein [Halobacterium]MDH5020451.1 hypothetical protein [Halobacterium rubrum]
MLVWVLAAGSDVDDAADASAVAVEFGARKKIGKSGIAVVESL